MPLITLTTDFGTRDWFVGVMKGVLLSKAPRCRVIDITHEVPQGDIRAGAFALLASYRFFPRRAVHVAVVDPGVGSARTALAVKTRDYLFIGPDNGVLSWALRAETIQHVHAIENPDYMLKPVTRTFHGRDVFAPAAAWLSRGIPIQRLGPEVNDFVRLRWPESKAGKGRITGEVLYVDRFGNALTNIDVSTLDGLGKGKLEVSTQRLKRCRVRDFYESVPAGQPVALVGSSGLLELAVNGGSAARKFRLKPGDSVAVRSSD